jgi:hypothetical protein
LNRWKNYFCQLLDIHGINDVRQTERHAAEPLVSELSSFKVEIAIENLKRYKSGTDQILTEIIQAGDNTLCPEIYKLINSTWSTEELPQQIKEYITPTYKKGNRTNWSNYRGLLLLPTTYKIISNILVARPTPYKNESTGDYQCGF